MTCKNQKVKKILIILVSVCIILSCSVETAAKQITGTVNDGYRKSLEERYGFNIIIDESVKNAKNSKTGEGFYSGPVPIKDIELKILKDIDSAFSMLPAGFVKEVNDYFKKNGFRPKIDILYGKFNDGEAAGKFYWEDVSINIVDERNNIILNLLHEFGHEVQCCLALKNISNGIEKYFTAQNFTSKYQYNSDYERLKNTPLDSAYFDYYLSVYASKDFMEDFAEIFAYAVTQPIYISSYGNGNTEAIHNKINKVSQVLCDEFKSLKDSKFLLNCLPDAPSKWAEPIVKAAKDRELIPWKIYGLNHSSLTRYDAALVLQPLLYKYIDGNTLFKRANLLKNTPIPENFAYDIINAEDIILLHNLSIMQSDKGRFDPIGKIQRQSAAEIFTKIAKLFGLTDTSNKDLKCGDAGKIGESYKKSVKFVLSMNIMGVDEKNNFNPDKYITYQDFYSSLLNLCNLKDAYNKKYNIKPPAPYYQDLSVTAISTSGWIYYQSIYIDDEYFIYSVLMPNVGGFTGKGKIKQSDGGYFEGEWKDGDFVAGIRKFIWVDYWQEGEWRDHNWNGKGRQVWTDGSWFEGEWKKGYFVNGLCLQVFEDGSWFKGEYKNGDPWNGEGVTIQNGKSYEFKYINGEFKR